LSLGTQAARAGGLLDWTPGACKPVQKVDLPPACEPVKVFAPPVTACERVKACEPVKTCEGPRGTPLLDHLAAKIDRVATG
jgi:hypothetical protein